jgi:hypothetical protein
VVVGHEVVVVVTVVVVEWREQHTKAATGRTATSTSEGGRKTARIAMLR